MGDVTIRNPEVDISEYPSHPQHKDWEVKEAVIYNTRISGDPEGRPALEIWKKKKEEMDEEELKEEEKDFLEFLADRGHISAFYQANLGITYQVPRHTTLFLCSFDHPKYLQQSQRYTKAEEFISFSDSKEVKEMFAKQSELYNRMLESDSVPKEDARYILPLGTAATHIHQNTNLSGLMNIYRVLKSEGSVVPKITKDIFHEAIANLEDTSPDLFNKGIMDALIEAEKGYPVANMFCERNRWIKEILKDYDTNQTVSKFSYDITEELERKGENFDDEALSFLSLSNQSNKVEGFITTMSISAWHQFMRNDTVKQSVESVYDAAERGEIIVPHTIEDSKFKEEYLSLLKEALELYERIKERESKERAMEVLPHGLGLGIAFSLDGFNRKKGFLPDRTQEAAQWEIREIARHIDKNF
ncbi:MAG: FAD-dependent thymidylate synthase [Candidatus Aenigmatarchaeota archaeon]